MTNEQKPDVGEIAHKVAAIIEIAQAAIELTGITEEEITAFWEYNSSYEGIGHIIDPTSYRTLSQDRAFRHVKQRLAIVRDIINLPDSPGKPDSEAVRLHVKATMLPLFLRFVSPEVGEE